MAQIFKSRLGYTFKRIRKVSKMRDSGNYCFCCKKEKEDFSILSGISFFWKGVCTECAEDVDNIEEYNKEYDNFIKFHYEYLLRFKEKWLKEQKKYLVTLDELIAKGVRDKILEHFKLGIIRGYIFAYCRDCYIYDVNIGDSDNFRLKSSNSYRQKGTVRLCKKHLHIHEKNKRTPEQNRKSRIAYESKVKYSQELDANLPRKKIKKIEDSLRNMKLTKKERRKLVQYYTVASKLSKRYGVAFHVDHIIPLRGDNIIGLNHPDNLQILKYDINIRKGNNIIFKEGLSFEELRDLNSLDIWGNYKINKE